MSAEVHCVCRPGDLCLACHREAWCVLQAGHLGKCLPRSGAPAEPPEATITLTLAGLPRHCDGCGSTDYRLSTFADSLSVACASCHRRIGTVGITVRAED